MEPDPMVVLTTYPSADAAHSSASSLVEHGLGAAVDATDDGKWAVTVLRGDRGRARELMGLPAAADDGSDGDGEELTQSVRSTLVPVLIGIAALILVPLVAFFISYKLSGG